tara:strand:- start:238 stop:609 length:372 start_codon:yes stop_codon:yes gene_type:complete
MVHNLIQWNLSDDKCSEIIHLTLIDLLNERKDKIIPLNQLIELLNARTWIYKIHNQRKYNTFSKYLKHKHNGILNFIELFNIYGVIKTDKQIFVQLYPNLINLSDIKHIKKRITKDSEWVIIE